MCCKYFFVYAGVQLNTCLFLSVDETRVVLTPIEGAKHDYINANFIDVSNSVGLFLFTF